MPYAIPLAAALFLLISCGGEAPRQSRVAPGASVSVQTVAVSAEEWPASYEATGTVRARTTATVSSRVMAYARQVSVQAGDHVTAGQTLVTLDTRDLEANLRRAEAARAEVQSAMPEADSGVAAAKAALDLAQLTYQRIEGLAAKKSVSSQEFDEASARLKAAQAAHEMARSRRAQLDPRMAQVEQEIAAARIALDWARITAPFDGVVTAKFVEPGNLAAPGAPLLAIEQEGHYRLEASVEESKIGAIRVGQSVTVALEAPAGQLEARVAEIAPVVDSASRAYVVKIDLPAGAHLRSGMFGRAVFSLGKRTVLALPASAVTERGQLQSVFVAEEGTAHTRLVTIGQRSKDAVEALSGLNAGERVVAPVPPGLQDGARLEVRP